MLKEIKLTNGMFTIVDNEDYDKLVNSNWYYSNGYAKKSVKNESTGKWRYIYLHRLITDVPRKIQIDHINGNRLDNRRENLRFCTNAENGKNRKISKNNTSKFKGVFFYKKGNSWRSMIRVDGRRIFLGDFGSAEAAYEAYCKASSEFHKNFGRIK